MRCSRADQIVGVTRQYAPLAQTLPVLRSLAAARRSCLSYKGGIGSETRNSNWLPRAGVIIVTDALRRQPEAAAPTVRFPLLVTCSHFFLLLTTTAAAAASLGAARPALVGAAPALLFAAAVQLSLLLFSVELVAQAVSNVRLASFFFQGACSASCLRYHRQVW